MTFELINPHDLYAHAAQPRGIALAVVGGELSEPTAREDENRRGRIMSGSRVEIDIQVDGVVGDSHRVLEIKSDFEASVPGS